MSEIDGPMRARADELMADLRLHQGWYAARAWHMQVFYVVLVAIASISGVVATLLLNLEWLPKEGLWHNIVTTLPAVASLAVVILATFGIRDLWQLRESGFYDVMALEIALETLMLGDPTKLDSGRLELKEKLRKIAERQAKRVIGALGGSDKTS